jgi:hypothetical protein
MPGSAHRNPSKCTLWIENAVMLGIFKDRWILMSTTHINRRSVRGFHGAFSRQRQHR